MTQQNSPKKSSLDIFKSKVTKREYNNTRQNDKPIPVKDAKELQCKILQCLGIDSVHSKYKDKTQFTDDDLKKIREFNGFEHTEIVEHFIKKSDIEVDGERVYNKLEFDMAIIKNGYDYKSVKIHNYEEDKKNRYEEFVEKCKEFVYDATNNIFAHRDSMVEYTPEMFERTFADIMMDESGKQITAKNLTTLAEFEPIRPELFARFTFKFDEPNQTVVTENGQRCYNFYNTELLPQPCTEEEYAESIDYIDFIEETIAYFCNGDAESIRNLRMVLASLSRLPKKLSFVLAFQGDKRCGKSWLLDTLGECNTLTGAIQYHDLGGSSVERSMVSSHLKFSELTASQNNRSKLFGKVLSVSHEIKVDVSEAEAVKDFIAGAGKLDATEKYAVREYFENNINLVWAQNTDEPIPFEVLEARSFYLEIPELGTEIEWTDHYGKPRTEIIRDKEENNKEVWEAYGELMEDLKDPDKKLGVWLRWCDNILNDPTQFDGSIFNSRQYYETPSYIARKIQSVEGHVLYNHIDSAVDILLDNGKGNTDNEIQLNQELEKEYKNRTVLFLNSMDLYKETLASYERDNPRRYKQISHSAFMKLLTKTGWHELPQKFDYRDKYNKRKIATIFHNDPNNNPRTSIYLDKVNSNLYTYKFQLVKGNYVLLDDDE